MQCQSLAWIAILDFLLDRLKPGGDQSAQEEGRQRPKNVQLVYR
jgi:hypothetical protein